jgi:hypothetical protein
MAIIKEWRSREISFEDYLDIQDIAYNDGFEIDSDGNWIALEAEHQLVFAEISEPSFEHNLDELIFDEQGQTSPEPEDYY